MGAQLRERQMDEGRGNWRQRLACKVTVAVETEDKMMYWCVVYF